MSPVTSDEPHVIFISSRVSCCHVSDRRFALADQIACKFCNVIKHSSSSSWCCCTKMLLESLRLDVVAIPYEYETTDINMLLRMLEDALGSRSAKFALISFMKQFF